MDDAISARNRVDARPILSREANSSWSKVEKAATDIHLVARAAVDSCGAVALVLKSNQHESPAWVKVEFWTPHADPHFRERCSVLITISARPYFRFDPEFQVDLTYGGRTKRFGPLFTLPKAKVEALVRFLFRGGTRPSFGGLRLRTRAFQLWRPRNKVTTLRIDPLPFLMIGLLAGGGALISTDPVASILLGLLLLIGGAAILYRLLHRPLFVRDAGKPIHNPRNLIQVDTWQTLISGLASECESLRGRFVALLRDSGRADVGFSQERIWYWGLDGPEVREQFVLEFKRALLFCHIYAYGTGLFVGWDAHLNHGQWVECDVRRGIDRASGEPTLLKSVTAGTQVTNEYDVLDVGSLIEWTHAELVHLVKQLIAENKIEQEIDFKIVRGERRSLIQSKQDAKQGGGFLSRLRRAA